MARSEIPIVDLVRSGVSPGSQVTADASNKHYVRGFGTGVFLEIVSTDGSDRTVAIKASPDFTADGLVVGDLTITVPAGGTVWCAPFKVATFKQNATVDMYIDPSVSTTLKFRCARVPSVAG